MKRMLVEAIAVIAVACVLAVAVYGCTAEDVISAGTGETLQETLDRECLERGLTCARVYEFATVAENPLGLVEMCVREEDLAFAESLYGDSMFSSHERFQRFYVLGIEPMCIWCQAFGGNSYSGSFNCPGTEMM